MKIFEIEKSRTPVSFIDIVSLGQESIRLDLVDFRCVLVCADVCWNGGRWSKKSLPGTIFTRDSDLWNSISTRFFFPFHVSRSLDTKEGLTLGALRHLGCMWLLRAKW